MQPRVGRRLRPNWPRRRSEFEAILLQNWLEKMNKSFADDGDKAGADAAHDTITSMGAQAVATALSARGGIGIAGMMLRHLAASGKRTG